MFRSRSAPFGLLRTAGAVALILASVALAACGGEDDPVKRQPRSDHAQAPKAPATPGKAPGKTDFLREADLLCAGTKRQVTPIFKAVAAKVAAADAAGVAAQLRKGLPLADQLLSRMRALTPPKGDEALFDRYLDTIARQKRRIGPLVEALEAEDISSIEVLVAELGQGNQRARRLASGYGFKECGPVALPDR